MAGCGGVDVLGVWLWPPGCAALFVGVAGCDGVGVFGV